VGEEEKRNQTEAITSSLNQPNQTQRKLVFLYITKRKKEGHELNESVLLSVSSPKEKVISSPEACLTGQEQRVEPKREGDAP
jgi:hypothetical protein